MCLHTFTVVKTSPASRKTSNSLQRLKRNLTILTRAFNVTRKSGDHRKRTTKSRNHCLKSRLNSDRLDPGLVDAGVTNIREVKLFSKNNYFLQITNDGSVNGTHYMEPSTGE